MFFRRLAVVAMTLGPILAVTGCRTGDSATEVKQLESSEAKGFDMSGQPRSCEPLGPNQACTLQFTPNDQFANDCTDAGGTKTTCACHDHICSKNIRAVSGDGWRHLRLQSSQDTGAVEIKIDYQFKPDCARWTENGHDQQVRLVDPVWFNVVGVPSGKRLQARMEFWQQSNILHGSQQDAIVRVTKYNDRDLGLQYADGNRYTINPNSIVVRHASGAANQDDRVFQRLRFTIDGQPLKDPVSNSEWFEMSLDNGQACF